MDDVKARNLEQKLSGESVNGWTIECLIGHGKSAAVFKARRQPMELAAVKIFDDELIEQYGDITQKARIARELSLIGERHPHLVSIVGGGVDEITGNHFIIMNYIEGPNLAQCLNEVPYTNVTSLIAQLASAAQFLEKKGLCHRDIKPSNVSLTGDFSNLVLLDLGVLRPTAGSTLTDMDGILPFVGTLQYSSPEFLMRKEEDTLEGWRALTFYQIGAVLHDLIMRRPLFEDFKDPYPRLVQAVLTEIPQIKNDSVSSDLLNLAGRCLLKDPKLRIKHVTWDDFQEGGKAHPLGSAKQRVTNRIVVAKATAPPIQGPTQPASKTDLQADILDFLKASVRTIRTSNDSVPRGITHQYDDASGRCILCTQFEASSNHHLAQNLFSFLVLTVDDPAAKAIELSAFAHLGAECPPPPLPEAATSVIFKGIYDPDLVLSALEDYVFAVLDAAQETDVSVQDVWLSPKIG